MTALPEERRARRLRLMTPEGVPLELRIASAGARLAAFGVDFLIMVAATVLAVAPLVLLSGRGALVGLALVLSFVIWNGYFLYFELRWQGRSPGKRWLGLQVIARDGGSLGTGAVIARNLMRELELYLPLKLLLAPELVYGPAPGWAQLLASGWAFAFLLLPLMNRDRARVGDLVAGTLVVERPGARLLPDAAALRLGPVAPSSVLESFTFRDAQLDMYGIRELQVLEELLRREAEQGQPFEILRAVCDRICLKIGWKTPVPDRQVLAFLQAFYRAQRQRLEHRMLLGERREQKKPGRLQGPG
jgi:uncharacterized RDD family membrane protein YckC